MPAVRMWLRIDLVRRWRSLVALALLVALAAGTIMAALAGARRAGSVVDRLVERTLPASVAVLPNTPGFDWEPVRNLPEVEALSTIVIDYAISVEAAPDGVFSFPPGDADILHTLEVPVLREGRLLDPSRPDEVMVTPRFAENTGKGVGDTLAIQLPTRQQLADIFEATEVPALAGPVVQARIVGIGVSPWHGDYPGRPGAMIYSPGLAATYPELVIDPEIEGAGANSVNALVRVRGGEAGLPAFQAAFERLTGRSDIEFMNLAEQGRAIHKHVVFEAQSLAAFAVAVLAAAMFLVGQALVRFVAGAAAELTTMRALGMSPRQAVLAAALGPAGAGLVGVLLGTAGAVAASPLFPIGTAGYLEAYPGLSVDLLVLGSVGAAVVVLVAAGALLAARSALVAARRDRPSRRSVLAGLAHRASLGIPVVIGTRFALESGRGRTAVPVRPALLGAVVGVLGVVGAFTFSHGVADAAGNPERFGQTFQYSVYAGFNDQDLGKVREVAATLAEQPETAGVADSRSAVATGPDGEATATLYEHSSGTEPLPTVVVEGRMPSAPDEVALAPKTLTALDVAVGDPVALSGSAGSPQTFRITGSALVPMGPHNGYADGGWVSTAGYDRIFDGFKFRFIFIALADGADPDTAAAALETAVVAEYPDLPGGLGIERTEPPEELAQLEQVRRLPLALGGFLALLALGAVGHALATAVRRRRHDIAVLRAVGMTRRQARWAVVVQATVLACFGLLVGVPLGLALGRTLWRVVADFTPLEYVTPVAFWVLVLIVPVSLLTANLLAAWPGRMAARLRVAQVLRAE